jgi:hypothetical protein
MFKVRGLKAQFSMLGFILRRSEQSEESRPSQRSYLEISRRFRPSKRQR